MNRQGSATLMVLSLLLFLSALFLGGAAFIELSIRNLGKSRLRADAYARLRAAAEATVGDLLSDPTPFADSPLDPVWAVIEAPRGDGITVELVDVSSRLGLNWIRKEVLADTGALLPGHAAQEVQELRESAGLRLNLDTGFGSLVEANALEQVFTPYGWFNINIADEFVLRAVHRSRSGDPAAAERFHLAVQQARIAHRVISSEQLGSFLGEDGFRLLFPVVNAEPALNLHFVPERVLEVLCFHYKIPAAGARSLGYARRAGEVTPGDLQRLLDGTPNGASLAPYLGLRTWFWRITVQQARQRLEWIVARVPRRDGTPEFRFVEERFQP